MLCSKSKCLEIYTDAKYNICFYQLSFRYGAYIKRNCLSFPTHGYMAALVNYLKKPITSLTSLLNFNLINQHF